jgi:5'-nucleotidase
VTLDPAATYRIVTNNFLADGGDAFTVFTEGTNRTGGGDDLVALTDFLEASSPVAPPADRIAGI